MSLEISAKTIEPIRQTYDQVARHIGEGKPASRYQEATIGIQPTTNFHYRPLWDPEHEVYDESRTAIVMKNWYDFKDPRQFYYGAYTMARSKQQEVAESNYAFVEKRDQMESISHEVREKVRDFLVPLRHVEWGANMNNCAITDFGYGTAITQVTMFNAIDRLGLAQYISRIGLLVDGNETTSLESAKEAWLNDEVWQKLRHAVEDTFVLDDWFEIMVAQNVIMDGLIYPLMFERFIDELNHEDGATFAMLTEFMNDWYAETVRWTNALIKVTAKESPKNATLLAQWTNKWADRLTEALMPIGKAAFAGDGDVAVNEVKQQLLERLSKQGLDV